MTQSEQPLTRLERAVLQAAFQGDGAGLAALRSQAELAIAVSRTPSGVGFMTKLQIPADAPCLPAGAPAAVPTIYGEHPDLPEGAEFLIQLKDGRVNCIEAFCYQGMWPADEAAFRIRSGRSYYNGDGRIEES